MIIYSVSDTTDARAIKERKKVRVEGIVSPYTLEVNSPVEDKGKKQIIQLISIMIRENTAYQTSLKTIQCRLNPTQETLHIGLWS